MSEITTDPIRNWATDTEVRFQVARPRRIFPISIPASPVSVKKEWWEKIDSKNSLLKGKAYFIAKRMLDIFLVVASLPFLLPIMGLAALAIKLESPDGPVLFYQSRTGKGGRKFSMLKFRTMVPDAEEQKLKLLHLNELKWPDFKITNDPRQLKVGRILRKTSMDELPQLFNILKGEMSLVGPRPTSFSPETYQLWQTERLDVTPGLTGLWQVIGRGSMEFDERVRLDVAYIQRRCMVMDILILFQTVAAVIKQKGAY